VRRLAIPGIILLIGIAIWFTTGEPLREKAPDQAPAETTPGVPTPGVVSGDGAAGPESKPPVELPADGLPVAGTVVGEDDRPIPGVAIRVRPAGDDGWAYARLLTATTGSDGRFRLERVPRGRVRVIATARYRQSLGVDAEAGDTAVRLTLSGAGEIHGKLVLPEAWPDPDGRLIQIWYECVRGPEESDTVVSDPEEDRIDGLAFRLTSLPPGRYVVWARIVGLGSGEVGRVEVRAGVTTEVEIAMGEGGVLTGLVLDQKGKPIAGSTVGAIDMEWGSGLDALAEHMARWHLGVIVRTDASGRYRMVGLREGAYAVGAKADGHGVAQQFAIEVPRVGDVPVFRLGPGASLKFRILDVEEDLAVWISLESGTLEAAVDEEGWYRIESIPLGEHTIGIWAKGWSMQRVQEFKGPVLYTIGIMRPQGLATLTGRVTRGGVPQPRRRLLVGYSNEREKVSFSGITDAAGRFRLEDLPTGTPGIQVGGVDRPPSYRAQKHIVALSEGENACDIELAAGSIRLEVVDAQTGEPIWAAVAMRGRRVAQKRDPEDELLIEDLDPGLHVVVVRSRLYGPKKISVTAAIDPKPVRVALVPAAELLLTIRGEKGSAIDEAEIQIVTATGWDLGVDAHDWGFADEKVGEYRFRLERGTYTLRVGAEGYRTWEQKVGTPVPGGGIEIVLRKE